MSTKRMLMATAVGLSMLCWHTAQADTWTDENGVVWTYTIKDGVATVGDGRAPAIPVSTEGNIVIPDTLGGCPVRTIAYYAFYKCTKVKSFKIPDTVTVIGKSAFANCTSLRIL